MYAKNKSSTGPSDIHAKEKLNLYIYEYLYHIGASKAAQGFCADMKWDPNKLSLGEAPGFLLSWWCVFWDLYSAAPERRDQHPHSEEAKAFHDYGFINANFPPNGVPPQGNPNPNPNSSQPQMIIGDNMHNPSASFFNPNVGPIMNPYQRFPNNPPRGLVRMPTQSDYPVGPNGGPPMMTPQMDPARANLRMTPPGARMPNPSMGHSGPTGPPAPPNSYRQPMPSAMSPSINQPGNRMFIPNSPGVGGYSSSSPLPYSTPCPTNHPQPTSMSASPQDPNGAEMGPYGMRPMTGGMPTGPNPMQYHEPHLNHLQPMASEISHHGSLNGDYESQLKQSPSQPPPQGPPQVPPPDGNSFPYVEDQASDTNAILKIKESMQEEVKRFDKTPNNSSNDDFNQYNPMN